MLRDEMRKRFDVLEKKFTINEDNSVDVSMDGKLVYKVKDEKVLSSQSLEEDVVKLVSPVSKDKEAADGTEIITSNQNKVLDKVVGHRTTLVIDSTDDAEELLEEDTAGDVAVVKEEEVLNVDIINDKQHEERLITTSPTRVLTKAKRNKLKKQQAKGKRRQKKKNNSPLSSVSFAVNPTGYGILTIFVTLINAIPTLLLMRGGKRLYMLLAFIAASYLFKGEMNSVSSVSDGISASIGNLFSIGSSFSFIQGVRALEDCPDHRHRHCHIRYRVKSYN